MTFTYMGINAWANGKFIKEVRQALDARGAADIDRGEMAGLALRAKMDSRYGWWQDRSTRGLRDSMEVVKSHFPYDRDAHLAIHSAFHQPLPTALSDGCVAVRTPNPPNFFSAFGSESEKLLASAEGGAVIQGSKHFSVLRQTLVPFDPRYCKANIEQLSLAIDNKEALDVFRRLYDHYMWGGHLEATRANDKKVLDNVLAFTPSLRVKWSEQKQQTRSVTEPTEAQIDAGRKAFASDVFSHLRDRALQNDVIKLTNPQKQFFTESGLLVTELEPDQIQAAALAKCHAEKKHELSNLVNELRLGNTNLGLFGFQKVVTFTQGTENPESWILFAKAAAARLAEKPLPLMDANVSHIRQSVLNSNVAVGRLNAFRESVSKVFSLSGPDSSGKRGLASGLARSTRRKLIELDCSKHDASEVLGTAKAPGQLLELLTNVNQSHRDRGYVIYLNISRMGARTEAKARFIHELAARQLCFPYLGDTALRFDNAIIVLASNNRADEAIARVHAGSWVAQTEPVAVPPLPLTPGPQTHTPAMRNLARLHFQYEAVVQECGRTVHAPTYRLADDACDFFISQAYRHTQEGDAYDLENFAVGMRNAYSDLLSPVGACPAPADGTLLTMAELNAIRAAQVTHLPAAAQAIPNLNDLHNGEAA